MKKPSQDSSQPETPAPTPTPMPVVNPANQPQWQEKAWGRTRQIVANSHVESWELEVGLGGYSSIHRHFKWNHFFVMSGALVVRLFATDLDGAPNEGSFRDYPLKPGDFIRVAPRTWHQFLAPEDDCHLVETYWAQVYPQDIERHSEGGSDLASESSDDSSSSSGWESEEGSSVQP